MQMRGLSESTGKSTNGKAVGKRTRTGVAAKKTLRLNSNDAASEGLTTDLADMIATAAYFCAERRQFAPGHELEDWLMAENQVRAAVAPTALHGN